MAHCLFDSNKNKHAFYRGEDLMKKFRKDPREQATEIFVLMTFCFRKLYFMQHNFKENYKKKGKKIPRNVAYKYDFSNFILHVAPRR